MSRTGDRPEQSNPPPSVDADRASEERLRLAVDAVGMATWEWRRDTNRSYWSPELEAMHGVAPGSFDGNVETLMAMVVEEDRPAIDAAIARTLESGAPYRAEFRIVRASDSALRWLSARGQPLRGLDGEIERVVGIVVDTTERRQLEEQLRQAQKLEAVGQLAGGVAHDFNNLLTVIKVQTEYLLDSLAEGDRRRLDVQEIKDAAGRASALVRQLLAFSRKQVLRPRAIDLNATIAGVETMLRRLLGGGLTLVMKPGTALWPVMADAGQIEQVLINLTVNARDAMPAGGTLTIETTNVELSEDEGAGRALPEPHSYVALVVSDTGAGMTRDVQDHIFEPFFTTKPPGAGTGLGLATVYGIVRQSNGAIRVQSEPGRGTRFEILLPRASACGADAGAAAPDRALESTPSRAKPVS